MRRLIEKLRKVKSPLLCKEHDSKKFPGVIANERCYTCELDMCYMCGNKHYEHGCDVESNNYYLLMNRIII